MELNNSEKELLNNYIPTLKRHFKKNENYNFFKPPFFEKFVLKLSLINTDTELISDIIDKINNNIISNEDIYFSINYYYNFPKNIKSSIQKFIFHSNDAIHIKFKANVVLLNVKYFQYYYFLNELLFNENNSNSQNDKNNSNSQNDKNNSNNDINHELFYTIYLFLKNNDSEYSDESTSTSNTINIKQYCRKYFNMKIFFYLMDDIFRIYKKNVDLLIKNEVIEDMNIHLLFTNNIFSKWSLIYKKMIENDHFGEIEKNYKLKSKSLRHFICSKNIC